MSEKVTDTITYIGCDDHPDLFESQYHVPNGMAYNSYLIKGPKNIVMDTIDKSKGKEWMQNLKESLNGEKVDYLVVQHLEPDHSYNIDAFLDEFPDATLVASKKAIDMMPNFLTHDVNGKTIAVKDGDTLSNGERELAFITAPMVHWPEVIMTYDPKDKVLFSADAFGKFGTKDADEPWDEEGARYFLNIVGKYGMQVQNVLKKAAGLDIAVIAPLHGPILDKDLGHYISLYDTWSKYEADKEGIFIAVASIHGHTNIVADKLRDILVAKGQKVHLMDITRQDVHEAVANCFRYPKVILVACSYDAGVFAPMERMLHILTHKNWQNRIVGMVQNGSWAPSAAKTMKEILAGCKNMTYVEPVVTIKTSLKETDIPALEQLADGVISA